MAIVYLVFAIVIAIGAVIFALQNSVPVTVTLIAWNFSGSLSLILLVTLLIGICIGALVLLPGTIKRSFQATGLKRTVAKLEKAGKITGQEAPATDADKKQPLD